MSVWRGESFLAEDIHCILRRVGGDTSEQIQGQEAKRETMLTTTPTDEMIAVITPQSVPSSAATGEGVVAMIPTKLFNNKKPPTGGKLL